MRNRFLSLIFFLVALFTLTFQPVRAQGPAAVAPMHFHHVHLNSVNPRAAAEYYPKPFPVSATKTTFNGYEAVKTGNVYLLFTKVNTPPLTELNGPQTSVWHFGWNTPDSRKYDEEFRAKGLKIAQMWDAADGKLVDMSSDTLPGLPTQEQILEMRAKGVQPTREGGFGYLRGPDGAMIENAQSGRWNASTTSTCIMSTRCVRCSGMSPTSVRPTRKVAVACPWHRPLGIANSRTPRRHGRRSSSFRVLFATPPEASCSTTSPFRSGRGRAADSSARAGTSSITGPSASRIWIRLWPG